MIDDTLNIQRLLEDVLSSKGYKVVCASNGRDAFLLLKKQTPDLILLDIMMPQMDGYTFISKLRESSNLPVIMITAKQEEEDLIKGFKLGADDYITKPFKMSELIARITAVLKRTSGGTSLSSQLSIANLALDMANKSLKIDGEIVDLTQAELALLSLLMQSVEQTVSKADICMHLMDQGYSGSESTLKIHIRNLRHKLEPLIKEIVHWYAAENKWEGFPEYFHRLHPPPKKKKEEKANVNTGPIKRHGILDANDRALLRYGEYQAGDIVPKTYTINAIPIQHQGRVIAKIIPPDVVGLSLNSELNVFLNNLREVLVIAVSISLFVSLVMGLMLARVMLKPIESLRKATSEIAHGKLHQQVPVDTSDEIGELAQSFNKMSRDLATADKQRRQLTADITHDLGTPIQVISGYIEMAQEGVLELNQTRIDTIAEELKRVNRLIEDMSLLAKTDTKTLSLQLAPTDIGSVFKRVVELYQGVCIEKGIDLSFVCNSNIPQWSLDEDRIVQVLGNLITNAMRYTPVDGEIKLQARYENKRLIIEVIDNGCGIAKEDLPFIFDRFYRSDSIRGVSGKMGLGLSISQGLIEMHEGRIRVESDGITGSCFQIIL